MRLNLIAIIVLTSQWIHAQDLSLGTAKKLAERAAASASKRSLKISVAIVNAEGNLVYFERGDGTYVGSIESALEKAVSANAFQRPTSTFVEAIKSGRQGLLSGKNIVAIEGGVPITLSNKHIGAIGISGARATEDEELAREALRTLTAK